MADKPTFKWYGKQYAKGLHNALFRGVKKATVYIRRKVVQAISKSSRVGGGGVRYPKKGAKEPMKFRHSRPGQPPRSDTGKLKQSIKGSWDKKKLIGAVTTMLKYGVYMEIGTKAHTIYPTRKKALVFGGMTQVAKKGTGTQLGWGWVFAKAVHHPGTKKRPYLWATVKKHKTRIRTLILSEGKKFHKGASGNLKLGA